MFSLSVILVSINIILFIYVLVNLWHLFFLKEPEDILKDKIFFRNLLGYDIYYLPTYPEPYAASSTKDQEIYLSSKLILSTEKRELSAIILHEIGHLKDKNLKPSKYCNSRNSLFPKYYYKCECIADDFAASHGYAQELINYFNKFVFNAKGYKKRSTFTDRVTYKLRMKRLKERL